MFCNVLGMKCLYFYIRDMKSIRAIVTMWAHTNVEFVTAMNPFLDDAVNVMHLGAPELMMMQDVEWTIQQT